MEKLTKKNYIGYALTDVAGMLAFSAFGAYLSVFWTDVLKISTTAVFVIMLAARIWDGINDPIMGFLVDRRPADKNGKFRSFLLWGGIPLAVVSAFVMFKIPGLSTGGYTAYAAVTYILYGMLYTVVLVPYGSMAGVMTRKENERSILSMCRTVGGGIGSLPATMLFPLLVFTGGVLNPDKLFYCMICIGALMIFFYILSFSWTKEYIPPADSSDALPVKEALGGLIRNRAFVIMSLEGCLLMAASMYLNTVNVYLFKDYFEKPGMLTFVTVASYVPMLAMIPFSNRLIERFGKKEVSIAGLVLASAASLLAFLLRVSNPWVYIFFCFLLNAGTGFMTLEIWAMAMDVIDANELATGVRQEAVSYSAFTFMRKVGQAISALAALLLGAVGYDSSLVGTGQNASTLSGMYSVATLVPCVIFIIMLALMLAYPLGRKAMENQKEQLAALREEK